MSPRPVILPGPSIAGRSCLLPASVRALTLAAHGPLEPAADWLAAWRPATGAT